MVKLSSLTIKRIFAGKANFGYCTVCERRTLFVEEQEWLRDHYRCIYCRSIPRHRALIYILQKHFPEYRDMKIHESSPSSHTISEKLRKECRHYTYSYFFPDVPLGNQKNGARCENLEEMTFEDNTFDLFITQDVLEHVLNPEKAFSEIARILKPGGAHVFTAPYNCRKKTLVRAVETPEGVKHLEEPHYHGSPINKKGSLVTVEWGDDFVDFIYRHSGMTTTIHLVKDRKLGLEAEFLEVFVSRKSR